MAESEAKLYSFVETPMFIRQLDRKASLDLLIAIQNDLLKDPLRGDVVSGTSGARKARIADANESRGKRGSYRYLYLYLEHRGRIYLLHLYAKNEQSDLSPAQKKLIAEAVQIIKVKLNMKASTQKTKKRYMSDEDFAELQESLSEAVAHAKGESNNCRVTTISLPPQPRRRSKANIVALRHRLNYSQVMFARALNVSPKTVQAWEQGLRVPSDAALKLLAIAEKHPEVLLDSV